jgi:hypothetical protein
VVAQNLLSEFSHDKGDPAPSRSMLQSFFKAPSVEIYWKHRSVTDTQVVNGWSLTLSTLGALKKLCNILRMEMPFATFQPLLPAKTALFTDTQVVNGWSLTPQKSKDKSFRTFQSAAVLRPSAYGNALRYLPTIATRQDCAFLQGTNYSLYHGSACWLTYSSV